MDLLALKEEFTIVGYASIENHVTNTKRTEY